MLSKTIYNFWQVSVKLSSNSKYFTKTKQYHAK